MQHDVFICHATEDKDELVRPLAVALQAEQMDVWYDEFSLKVGDSLRQSIDRGLAGARFGVVVLSRFFFQKPWTQWELNGLVARMMREQQRIILPIWHGVGPEDVAKFSPPLADIRALRSEEGIASLCKHLIDIIQPTASPLQVAKEELIRLGWDPPPISDEWWLTVVEAQSDLIMPLERRPWLFPRLGEGPDRSDRGLSIAWTALQLAWQDEADERSICQTTHPDQVLAFIDQNDALKEACAQHPHIVANYAPQLLIPQYSGGFRDAFDKLLAESALRMQKEPDRRFPGATCERYFALRLSDFGSNPAVEVADKWVNGRGGAYSAQHHHVTDYIFWLLSEDSSWMPSAVKAYLIGGLREWVTWRNDLIREDIWDTNLAKEIYGRARRSMRWTKARRTGLEETVSRSLDRLSLQEDPSAIANAFIDQDFVGALDAVEREYRRRQR